MRRTRHRLRPVLRHLLVVLGATGAWGVAGCQPGGGGLTAPLPAGGHRVLFVGNSLTYVNDLPRTLADMAASVGDTIRVASVALPDLALVDHAAGQSQALGAIRAGGWELVVMQQGPSSRGVNRDTLVIGAQQLSTTIRGVGARPALYMVWPAQANLADFDGARDAYLRAACAVDGLFLPVGEAWRAAWRRDATLPLYGADGFHPGPLGTYLAALVMYERITAHDARTLPTRAVVAGRTLDATAATVRLLQEAAHETNVAYAAPCGGGLPAR